MRILVLRRGNGFVAFDADSGDELSEGTYPAGAIGDAVMNMVRGAAWTDPVVIDDIEYNTP